MGANLDILYDISELKDFEKQSYVLDGEKFAD